jgi:hypothetical protein
MYHCHCHSSNKKKRQKHTASERACSCRTRAAPGIVFFSHNKSVSTDLSAAKTISQTARQWLEKVAWQQSSFCTNQSRSRIMDHLWSKKSFDFTLKRVIILCFVSNKINLKRSFIKIL